MFSRHHPEKSWFADVGPYELAHDGAIAKHRRPISYPDQFGDTVRDDYNAAALVAQPSNFNMEPSRSV